MKKTHRGTTLVELMVGLALGMFIVSVMVRATIGQLFDHRRLMLEAQVEQDLRAAADVMVRDLRRSGYWAGALMQLAAVGGVANPYAAVTAKAGGLTYAYSRDTQDDQATGDADASGVKLDGGVLKLRMGDAGWQSLTDPQTVTVRKANISLGVQRVPLSDYCPNPCPSTGTSHCPPMQELRDVHIQLVGVAAADAQVVRSLDVDVRLRNDQLVGACGA